jgi:hypothetical protein
MLKPSGGYRRLYRRMDTGLLPKPVYVRIHGLPIYQSLKSALWFSVSSVLNFHAYRTNSAIFTGMKGATFPRQGHKKAKLK